VVAEHLEMSPNDEPAIIVPTLAAIRDLVEPGWAIAGDAVQDTKGYAIVNSWKLTPSEAIARVAKEWGELERHLGLGDVVWLELTNAGRAEAQRMLASGRS
jgi:hypothetical protein